ncbi:protease inhibitor I42 family protein [Streptomyces sp. AV19]|uniref:protease inhibitor I42 family protein n=1 Tax=Streptomyces sp. AV19 TaxID=2793068 RepID=UPI0018FEBDD0|nr:protease inhibitor I42 family protein [Streptomyces sp. AV19]MBH1935948.1 protease inhibitor I42 family protein [Streptomyces sp. AV19]MDG4534263.1 protease inhibitor I42 family protein [Streptomyces sp. AV19]
MRHRRTAPVAPVTAVLLLLTLTGCGGDRDDPLGTVHEERTTTDDARDRVQGPLRVKRGERFSLALRENASARREWRPVVPGPPGDAVRAAGTSTHRTKWEKEAAGAGHTKYFTYEAVKPGDTRIAFTNRCGTDTKSGCYSPGLPRSLTFRVTVK